MVPAASFNTGNRDHRVLPGRGKNSDIEYAILLGAHQLLPVEQKYRLAADFDLTPRTARHYIENVLPAHHKTGRGKLARYGQDT